MPDDSGLSVPTQELRLLVADVLGLDASMVGEETGPATEPGWDSLGHLSIVTAVEQKYHVRFAMDEIRAIETVRDLASKIEERRGAQVQGRELAPTPGFEPGTR